MELRPPAVAGLFVTATSTEIGKTVVTCLIADQLRRRGLRPGVFKPVASGCVGEGTELVSEDALALVDGAGLERAAWQVELVNPVRYREPVAPAAAAGSDARGVTARGTPDWSLVDGALRAWESRCDVLLVEGIGGVMVPLEEAPGGGAVTVLDMMAALGLPVVVVADAALGTLNHTALTIGAVRGRGLEVAGVVLNNDEGVMGDPSVRTNARWIERQNDVPVLARVPRVGRWDAMSMDAALRGAIDQTDFAALARRAGAGAGA